MGMSAIIWKIWMKFIVGNSTLCTVRRKPLWTRNSFARWDSSQLHILDILAYRWFKQIKIRRKSCFLTTLTVGNPQVFRAKTAERLIFIPFSAQFRRLRSHSSIDLRGEIGALLVSFRENERGFRFRSREIEVCSPSFFDSWPSAVT